MAWNASVAAMNDKNQPRLALRVKAQREYFALGKDFLERGIKNNPDRPELYEALGPLVVFVFFLVEPGTRFLEHAPNLTVSSAGDKDISAHGIYYFGG